MFLGVKTDYISLALAYFGYLYSMIGVYDMKTFNKVGNGIYGVTSRMHTRFMWINAIVTYMPERVRVPCTPYHGNGSTVPFYFLIKEIMFVVDKYETKKATWHQHGEPY